MNWQPIDTARRSFDPILAFDARNGVHSIVAWYETKRHWCCYVTGDLETPTHWMPLPEPPQAQAASGTDRDTAGLVPDVPPPAVAPFDKTTTRGV